MEWPLALNTWARFHKQELKSALWFGSSTYRYIGTCAILVPGRNRNWISINCTALQHGTSSCLYNHDGFNSPTETKEEKWFTFILRSTGAAVSVMGAIARALRRAPNVLSALANKAFKVIVSCLTVWWIGQASTGIIYLKTVSCDKTSRCYDAIFYSVVLVSWMQLWLQLFIHIHICTHADVLICWINKTFQVSHLWTTAVSPKQNCECSNYWLYHCPVILSLFFSFFSLIFIYCHLVNFFV